MELFGMPNTVGGINVLDGETAASANELNTINNPFSIEILKRVGGYDFGEVPIWHFKISAVWVHADRAIKSFANQGDRVANRLRLRVHDVDNINS